MPHHSLQDSSEKLPGITALHPRNRAVVVGWEAQQLFYNSCLQKEKNYFQREALIPFCVSSLAWHDWQQLLRKGKDGNIFGWMSPKAPLASSDEIIWNSPSYKLMETIFLWVHQPTPWRTFCSELGDCKSDMSISRVCSHNMDHYL